MSTASQGRAREYRVRDALAAAGYPNIMRAAASKGAADLLHGNPIVGAVLVQVGKATKTLNQEARDRFCEAAALCHALPVLAQVIAEAGRATVIRYWLVSPDQPHLWTEWSP